MARASANGGCTRICDFRAFHLEELSALFVQGVKLARAMGLVKLGTVGIDGTAVKANASLKNVLGLRQSGMRGL